MELTERECRLILAEFEAKQKGYKFDPFIHYLPYLSDTGWLDGIEDWLEISLATTMRRENDWRYLADHGEDTYEGIGETRNLARARCLCKVIKQLERPCLNE